MEHFAEATNVGLLMQHLIRFCIYTGGQRPFEMIASQWCDVDFQQKNAAGGLLMSLKINESI
ncbi:integrase [Escherichia coli]|uniref:Integrase n=1 Tax=Escherichia coli TaxID=562 RepID=A0A376U8V4_ECOLX|nr:integrase [Escherichia coli]